MITNRQNEQFLQEVFGGTDRLLVDVISWIANTLNPQDVFELEDLEHWAESNGYVKEEK